MARVEDAPAYARRFAGGIERSVHIVALRLAALDSQATVPADLRKQALHSLNFAFGVESAWPDLRTVLLNLASRTDWASQGDDWLLTLNQGIVTAHYHGDVKTEARLHDHLGKLYEQRTQYSEAVRAFTQSETLYTTCADVEGQARAILRRAAVARFQQDLSRTEALLDLAQPLLPPHSAHWAEVDFLRGAIAFHQRQWQRAEDQMRRALQRWQEQGDLRQCVLCLRSLGPALHMQSRYAEAIHCYEEALALMQHAPDPVQQANILMNLGIVYSLQGQPAQALDLYKKAEPIYRSVDDRLRLASLYTNFGIELRKLGRWDEARTAYHKAIAAFEELGNRRSALNAADGLGLTYLAQGLTAEAALTFAEALTKLDELEETAAVLSTRAMLEAHLQTALEAGTQV